MVNSLYESGMKILWGYVLYCGYILCNYDVVKYGWILMNYGWKFYICILFDKLCVIVYKEFSDVFNRILTITSIVNYSVWLHRMK